MATAVRNRKVGYQTASRLTWADASRAAGIHDEPEFRVIRVDELEVCPVYQRPVHHTLSKLIGNRFDPLLAGTIVVSVRNGRNYVVDGQQRTSGARLAGRQELAALVVHGLTLDQEAELFLALNDVRVGVRAIDKFRAAHTAGANWALEIATLVYERNGRIAGLTENAASGVHCVEAMKTTYQRYGADGLGWILDVIVDAFDELNENTTTSPVIRGLLWVYAAHSDEIDRGKLAAKMREVGILTLTADAKQYASVSSSKQGASKGMYLALVGAYNKGRGSKITPTGRPVYRAKKKEGTHD